jgi:hypothetical protein
MEVPVDRRLFAFAQLKGLRCAYFPHRSPTAPSGTTIDGWKFLRIGALYAFAQLGGLSVAYFRHSPRNFAEVWRNGSASRT